MVRGMDHGRPKTSQRRLSGGTNLGERFALRHLQGKQYRSEIVFEIGQSGQCLVLKAGVLNHLSKHQQRDRHSPEAGGQLFASFNDQVVVVEEATGPRSSDRRFRDLFIPNRRDEQNEIYEMHRKGLHFVGDWHTHPEPIPSASRSDLDSIKEIFIKSKHYLNGFLMIIVGTDDFPSALRVSLHGATAELKLVPTASKHSGH